MDCREDMALKRYTAIQKLFNETDDDQFDFHGYSLRKFTINIYMKCVECIRYMLLRILTCFEA